MYFSCFFFFTAPAPTDFYTLSLHDALPIWRHHWRPRDLFERPAVMGRPASLSGVTGAVSPRRRTDSGNRDRKSTRLNSSHQIISYAVFCLKKKTQVHKRQHPYTNISNHQT